MNARNKPKRFCYTVLFSLAGLTLGIAPSQSLAQSDPYEGLPDDFMLAGIVRDFRERQTPGGHPDMEMDPGDGPGLYVGMVQDDLDVDGNPVFNSTGYLCTLQAMDNQGNPIVIARPHIQAHASDRAPIVSPTEGGAMTSAERFSEWFREVPGTNMSGVFGIKLNRQPMTNKYVFDDELDTQFVELGGFFGVNGQLFGNSRGGNRNYHYTFEIDMEFEYKEGNDDYFLFAGDDDVWVYIDNKLVIDLGGIHGRIEQRIDVDRLSWLEDGQTYSLKFFFAERKRPTSHCRIETTLQLRTLDLPPTTGLYD